ncbi:hypothetical protein CAPTEDRAFT_223159 [Capitella teleta]|uniref:Uncharacterized protein n=1 Tax=Capitella teleta TaxID=283909 RepID=R7V303_CAPTE|nr:hypothetical protein CAPTEDRAFT_223159 [Capitella teleta]|eukprot:ELU12949.1 hypothetical protein CAPTEDRAFT_223159 [Capitella teleta]
MTKEMEWKFFQWTFVPFFFSGYSALSVFSYSMYMSGGIAYWFVFVFLGMCISPLLYIQTRLGGVAVGFLLSIYITCIYFSAFAAFSVRIMYWVSQQNSNVSKMFSCDNWWNTPSCSYPMSGQDEHVEVYNYGGSEIAANVTYLGPETFRMPAEEFYQNFVMQSSSGLEYMGSVVKPLVPGLFVFWLCVFLVIGWGVAIYGMICGALNVVVLILWLAVLAKGFSAFGDVSSTGMAYYFYPSAYNLHQGVPMGIVRYVHALSIFGGLGVSFGKFSGQGTVSHISWLSLVVPVPIMLLLGTTLIAPYMAGLANHLNMDFNEIVFAGDSALYVTLTQTFAIVENGASWLQAFHILVFILVVIGTAYPMIVILDCLMSGFYKGILDRWLASEFVARLIVAAILCFASFIFSLPFILEGGRYLILCLDLAMFSLYPVFFVILTIGLIISYFRQTGIFFEEKVIACSFAGVATLVVCVIMMTKHEYSFISSQSTRYQVIGWISAILPFVIGAIAGTLDAFLRAPGDFIDKTVFMLMGEKDACPQSADVPMKPMEPMQEDPMLTGDVKPVNF